MSSAHWLFGTLLLLGLLGMVYLVASFGVSCWMTRPTRGRPLRTPADFGLSWEPVSCRTTDGVQLAGWVLTPSAPPATIVLHHGLRGSRDQTLTRAVLLARAGYRCVCFDHRANGESGGRATSFGYHEARDVADVLELVRQRWPDEPRAVLGMSMGAAAICFAAEHARDYHAVILESLYHDIASAFTVRLSTMYPIWFRPLVPGIIWMTERRLGIRLADVVPADYIGKLAPAPILLLTGSDDDHAGPAVAERLQKRCQGPSEVWIVPGAKHTDLLEIAEESYEVTVAAFLNKWLPG